MGRMRETSLQELADTKTDSPTLLWLGGIRNFCTISVKLHFRRIREIRVQKSFLRNLREPFTGRAWWRGRLLSPRRVRAVAR